MIDKKQKGQALVTLLVFVVMALIIISGSVAAIVINTRASSKYEIGEDVYFMSEAGIENAILRLIRNSNYSGETLAIDSGTVIITVSGLSTKTITAEGVKNGIRRKIQVTGLYSGNKFNLSSWSEID